jgi:hypothetical protein
VLHAHESSATILQLVDQGLGFVHVQLSIEQKRSIDEVHAHGAFFWTADATAEWLVADRLIHVAEDGRGFPDLFDES